MTKNGLTYQWPSAPAGTKNAIDTTGQAISLSGTGRYLGFLGSSTFGRAVGIGTIVYTDGTTQTYGLSFSDWVSTKTLLGSETAATFDYVDNHTGPMADTVHLYTNMVQLQPGKTVQTVILPNTIHNPVNNRSGNGHVFAVAFGGTASQSSPQPAGTSGGSWGSVVCLDLPGGNAFGGAQVVLNTCSARSPASGGRLVPAGHCEQRLVLSPADGGTGRDQIVLDTCTTSASQQWTPQTNGNLVNGGSGICLDDPNNSITDGTQLGLYACNSGAAEEQFLLPPASTDVSTAQPAGPKGQITTAGGKCLVLTGGTARVGTGVVVGACDTATARGWVKATDGTLWNGGYCASTFNGNPASSSRISLESCSAGATIQQWTTDAAKHLINGKSRTCMFDQGNNVDGKYIILFGCNTSAQQVFSLPTGSLTGPVALRAQINGRYVSATAAGTGSWSPTPPRSAPGNVRPDRDLGGGNVALRARGNNQFVCAGMPAQNRSSPTGRGRTVGNVCTDSQPGRVGEPAAAVNNKSVVAETCRGRPLIANRDAIGTWEKVRPHRRVLGHAPGHRRLGTTDQMTPANQSQGKQCRHEGAWATRTRAALLATGLAVAVATWVAVAANSPATAATATTAWRNGVFNVDRANVVRHSNIVLGQPNNQPYQFMPLGNGTLGAAVWSASGLTAQLNRSDTFPGRRSPGQVTIPGLKQLTEAGDFSARLDLYDGVLTETGGGMTATIYVRADRDELVIDVTGADPNSSQTVRADLWSGRSPSVASAGPIGTLSESWQDSGFGGSGETFGTLLGITAGARNVSSSTVDGDTAQVSFNPNTSGSFRVVVAAPHWVGGDAITTTTSYVSADAAASSSSLQAAHLAWWRLLDEHQPAEGLVRRRGGGLPG